MAKKKPHAKNPEERVQIAFRCSQESADRIDAVRNKYDLDLSNFMRLFVRKFLDKMDEQGPPTFSARD